MIRHIITVLVAALIFVGVAEVLTSRNDPPATVEKAASGEEFERGPHRGRLLRDGRFALEITIFEEGVPPEFHVYSYLDGKPLAPDEVELTIELGRLGGRVDDISFKPQGEYLLGNRTVVEPHSFDVRVRAKHEGRTSDWNYASYEGRTEIAAAAAEAAGIKADTVGPEIIRELVELTGTVALNPNRMARVGARFPGVVREVQKGVGDRVRAGETLAVIESNESLRGYPLQSPIEGVVLARLANVGHVAATDATLFEIADLSNLWAELHAFGRDAARIKPGQKVLVETLDGTVQAEGTVDFVSPHAEASSQTTTVRAVLDNFDSRWRPGSFVRGSVTLAEKEVPLAVKSSALQRFRDFTVVFAQFGDKYEVRMLDLGASDGMHTEVLSGIEPGQSYVAENSFLVKADIEKSGASHDH
jgi:cobalt-zinc-cadmium efflux system membrane fusion protein